MFQKPTVDLRLLQQRAWEKDMRTGAAQRSLLVTGLTVTARVGSASKKSGNFNPNKKKQISDAAQDPLR